MHPIVKLFKKKEKLVIGLMSGTSMDGIDAALTRIKNYGPDTQVELLRFLTFPYPEELRKNLRDIAESAETTATQLCQLNVIVGEYFADAALAVCQSAHVDFRSVDLIGSHGQTIQHLPQETWVMNKLIRSTLQIGEPAVIARRLNCMTVAHFRSADMALGGQGAPLVPYVDYILFRSNKLNRVVLNIGGIANITVLRKGCSPDQIIACDTGPGNMVVDALVSFFYNLPYDQNGQIALQGKVCDQLLSILLEHPFFRRPIPKSTGREEFGKPFVEHLLAVSSKFMLSPQDIIATATELTARTIAETITQAGLPAFQLHELIVSGGGAKNHAMMNSLAGHFKATQIMNTDDFQLPGDAKEAVCFAILANETIAAIPTSLPSVTGAQRPAILGAVYF